MGPFLTYVTTNPLDFCCLYVALLVLMSSGAASVVVNKSRNKEDPK